MWLKFEISGAAAATKMRTWMQQNTAGYPETFGEYQPLLYFSDNLALTAFLLRWNDCLINPTVIDSAYKAAVVATDWLIWRSPFPEEVPLNHDWSWYLLCCVCFLEILFIQCKCQLRKIFRRKT